MATIYNNPMPMSGALFVTNPQGRFYKWMARNYSIKAGKLKKRSSAVSSTSAQGSRLQTKSEWGKYQRIYDALPTTSSHRKAILTLHKKSSAQRARSGKAQRKKMMSIFEDSDWTPSKSQSRKRQSSKSSSTSDKRTGSRGKKTMAKRKLSAYNRHVKKLMKAGKTMKQAAAAWRKTPAGKKSKAPSKRRKAPARRRKVTAKRTVRKGRKRTSVNRGHSHGLKKRNPVMWSAPKYQGLVYPDTDGGKKLVRILESAQKYLPTNASDAEISRFVRESGAPSGSGVALAKDIRAAISATGAAKKSLGSTPLHSMARAAVKKLGRVPIDVSNGTVVDDKAWQRIVKYVGKLPLRPAGRTEMKKILADYYANPDANLSFLWTLIDEKDFKRSFKSKKSTKGRKTRKTSKASRKSKAKSSAGRSSGGSAFKRAGTTILRLGYTGKLGSKSLDTLKKRKAKITSLKAKGRVVRKRVRRNPAALGGFQPLQRGLHLMDSAQGLVTDAGHMIQKVPVVGKLAGDVVLFAAPYTKTALLGGTAVGLSALQMKYVTPTVVEMGRWTSDKLKEFPLAGDVIIYGEELFSGVDKVGYTLNGLLLAFFAQMGARYGLFDAKSAHTIGAAAVLTGGAIDMADHLRGQDDLAGLAEMGALAMNGAGYGDGGQYFLGGFGVAGAPNQGDYHTQVGPAGAPGPFYPQLSAGAFGVSQFYAHCKPQDAAVCPDDLDPDEIHAAKRGSYPSAFPPLPRQVVNDSGRFSKSAAKKGHKWGWLHTLIGEDNFRKLASLPAAKRRELVKLMKGRALDQAASLPLNASVKPLVLKERSRLASEPVIQGPSKKKSLIQRLMPSKDEPLLRRQKRLRREFNRARKPSSEALMQRLQPLPVGNFSAVEMGALAMNGMGAMGGLAELSGVTSDLSGGINTAGGVENVGGLGALLYAGAL